MSSLLTLAGNAAPTGFYDFPIEQSLRFNDDDNAYLSRTPASAGNRKTWTFSCWVKRGKVSGTDAQILTAYTSASDTTNIIFQSGGAIQWYDYISGYRVHLVTNALYRDVGSWYHLLFQLDTSNASSGDRAKIYVNGERVTSFSTEVYPSLNADLKMNTAIEHRIGDTAQFAREFDGYMADVNFIDGQALDPTSFGEFKSGIWTPVDTSGLTFGSNGFRLEYADSAAIGDDTSGNTNDWTANNLVASDVVLDSPTNNFATLNSSLPDTHFNSSELSEGNLFYNEGEGNNGNGRPTATFSVTSGKWYWEVQVPSQQNNRAIGFTRTDNIGKGNVTLHGSGLTASTSVVGIDLADDTIDQVDKAGTHTQEASGLTGMSNNDIFGISVDLDGGTFQMYRNGSTYGSSYSLDDLSDWQVHGMTPTASGDTYQAFRFNFGQDSTFANNTTAGGNADENGYGDFAHPVPSGYLALCSANLPSGAINTLNDETPEDYFNTVLYSGDSTSSNGITGVGFQPDLVWIKERNGTFNHVVQDSVRGIGATSYYYLATDNTGAEASQTDGDGLLSLDTDGFTVGFNDTGAWNETGSTYAAWNWKADGSGVSNTDGSITSTVSVGATSQQNWFSIVSYTGNGTAGATVGHGLDGTVPDMIIVKSRDNARDWRVYHSSLGSAYTLDLNTTNAVAGPSTAYWNSTDPTSSVFSIGSVTTVNGSGEDYIAYCFANAEGLCKVGSYVGNSSADGTFVYTGFRPAFVMLKVSSISNRWVILDNERPNYNPPTTEINPNSSAAEFGTTANMDFLSNGFKLRRTGDVFNTSGYNYIYIALAEQPFKFANAR